MTEDKEKKKPTKEFGRFSVSMDKKLIEKAKKAAEDENRSLSSYIANLIAKNT